MKKSHIKIKWEILGAADEMQLDFPMLNLHGTERKQRFERHTRRQVEISCIKYVITKKTHLNFFNVFIVRKKS